MSTKYRPEGELEKWKERDPLKIYRERMYGPIDTLIPISDPAKNPVAAAK